MKRTCRPWTLVRAALPGAALPGAAKPGAILLGGLLLGASLLGTGCAAVAARSREQERELVVRLKAEATDLRTEIRSAERRLKGLASESRASDGQAHELARLLRRSGIEVSARGASIVVAIADQVLFASGEATLRPEAKKRLAEVAAILKERFADRHVSVEGHTDARPPQKTVSLYPTNWELSAARAVTVARDLAEAGGVSPARITATAFADTRPLGKNETPQGRAANRRVEIVLLPPIETSRTAEALDR